jgi:hypothetical protein
MKTSLPSILRSIKLAAAACVATLAFLPTAWAQAVSLQGVQQGNAHWTITGTCTPGAGKVTLQLTPIALTPANYNGPKTYVTTLLQGLGGAAVTVTSASGSTGGHCKAGGANKSWLMKKSDWAPGQWELILKQGSAQSAPLTVNL